MDTNNRNNPEFNNMYDIDSMNNDENIYSINRYDNRRYNDDRRFDYDRMYNNDNRYDGKYYRYPYCDRYGRCGNPIWWLFWPFFFF